MDAQTLLDDGPGSMPRQFDGRAEVQKPPLYYWLVALAARAGGGAVDARAVRLPAAWPGSPACCCCTASPHGGAGRSRGWSRRSSWPRRFITPGWRSVGRIDMPLTLTTAVALLGFYRAWEDAPPEGGGSTCSPRTSPWRRACCSRGRSAPCCRSGSPPPGSSSSASGPAHGASACGGACRWSRCSSSPSTSGPTHRPAASSSTPSSGTTTSSAASAAPTCCAPPVVVLRPSLRRRLPAVEPAAARGGLGLLPPRLVARRPFRAFRPRLARDDRAAPVGGALQARRLPAARLPRRRPVPGLRRESAGIAARPAPLASPPPSPPSRPPVPPAGGCTWNTTSAFASRRTASSPSPRRSAASPPRRGRSSSSAPRRTRPHSTSAGRSPCS